VTTEAGAALNGHLALALVDAAAAACAAVVTRVQHEVLRAGFPVRRNSEFVKFFSNALLPAIVNYSRLRVLAFSRAM